MERLGLKGQPLWSPSPAEVLVYFKYDLSLCLWLGSEVVFLRKDASWQPHRLGIGIQARRCGLATWLVQLGHVPGWTFEPLLLTASRG